MIHTVYIVLMFAVPTRELDSGDIIKVFNRQEDAEEFVKRNKDKIKDFARYEIQKETVY